MAIRFPDSGNMKGNSVGPTTDLLPHRVGFHVLPGPIPLMFRPPSDPNARRKYPGPYLGHRPSGV